MPSIALLLCDCVSFYGLVTTIITSILPLGMCYFCICSCHAAVLSASCDMNEVEVGVAVMCDAVWSRGLLRITMAEILRDGPNIGNDNWATLWHVPTPYCPPPLLPRQQPLHNRTAMINMNICIKWDEIPLQSWHWVPTTQRHDNTSNFIFIPETVVHMKGTSWLLNDSKI